MTDETYTAERPNADRATERSTEDTRPRERPILAGWPLSTYVVAFGFLYLGGTALAMVVATAETANRLAWLGVSSLTIGLLLRIVEHAAGRRVSLAYDWAIRNGETAGRRATSRARHWLQRALGRLPAAGVRAKLFAVGDRNPNRRGRIARRTFEHGVPIDRPEAAETRSLVGLVTLFTFAGGLLVVLWRWSDPILFVSLSFLAGWLTSLGALVSLYAALGSRME